MGEPPLKRILEELARRHSHHARHLHADHIIPIDERPDLRLDLDNLATRCNKCHSARTLREGKGHVNDKWLTG
jgi:5-methylcytosine-specific restriction endonuclease McrA